MEIPVENEKQRVKVLDYIKDNILLFDGAMGSLLQQKGMKTGQIPELLNIEEGQLLREIHREYKEAGADVLSANTFGANSLKLKNSPYSLEEIITAGIDHARSANPKFIALDIGPLGQLMEPMGNLSFDLAYELFKEQAIA